MEDTGGAMRVMRERRILGAQGFRGLGFGDLGVRIKGLGVLGLRGLGFRI